MIFYDNLASICALPCLWLDASPSFSMQDGIRESHESLEAYIGAAITGLQEAGRLRSGETVLVTAAAGGVGQSVVQLAKQAGSTVIATCGSEDKARLLRRLGADRIVNYRQESLKEVLRKEYPKVITPAAAGSKLNVRHGLVGLRSGCSSKVRHRRLRVPLTGGFAASGELALA